MEISKQRQELDSFQLLHIVRYLQKGGGGNKALTLPVRQKTTSISDSLPEIE